MLVGDEPHRPYTRPPLSKELLAGATRSRLRLPVRGARRRVAARRAGDRARRAARLVTLGRRGGRVRPLIVATGAARARGPGEPAGLHTLRDLDDALALRAALRPRRPSRSSAPASSAAKWHRARASSASRSRCIDVRRAADAGARPRAGRALRGPAPRARRRPAAPTGVARRPGRSPTDRAIEADVVVVALGALPNTEWLEGSGLTLDHGVVVRRDAAGGARRLRRRRHRLAGRTRSPTASTIRVEHWTNAAEQGTPRRRNALAAPPSASPYGAGAVLLERPVRREDPGRGPARPGPSASR